MPAPGTTTLRPARRAKSGTCPTAAQRRTHRLRAQGIEKQPLARHRHPAADHHDVGGQERNHLCHGPAERPHGLAEDLLSQGVAFGRRLGHVLGGQASGRPSQRRSRSAAAASPAGRSAKRRRGSRGNGPAAGQGLDGLSGPLGQGAGPEVADLGNDSGVAAIDFSVDHQGAADPAAHVGIEHHPLTPARPEVGLGQAGGIGVVGQRDGGRPRFSRTQAARSKSSQPAT